MPVTAPSSAPPSSPPSAEALPPIKDSSIPPSARMLAAVTYDGVVELEDHWVGVGAELVLGNWVSVNKHFKF